MHNVNVTAFESTVQFSQAAPLAVIAGPCAIESRDMALTTAEALTKICTELNMGLVYKSSFDKANRTSVTGKRGVGMEEGLRILQEVRKTFKVPVITDIHDATQAAPVGEVVDILQIPAFLCRQTDLLLAAAATGKAVNVKKGQFLSPWDMQNVADKLASTGNKNILLTERGTSFGYNNLVVDMRGLAVMAQTGYPVIMDATHSVQMPGGQGSSSGGKREFVEPLARAAVAVGVAGVFIETHPNPAEAFSDGPNQIPLNKMSSLLRTLKTLDEVSKGLDYQKLPSVA